MPSRKGETTNHKTNRPGSQDYDAAQYYGDDDSLKISAFEEEKKLLHTRISDLKCWNTCLLVIVIVILFLSIVLMTFCIINQTNNSKHQMQIEKFKKRLNNTESSIKNYKLSHCSASSPCARWEGTCSSDSDCEGDLFCGYVRRDLWLNNNNIIPSELPSEISWSRPFS